jgi:hypothetical protein
LKNIINPICQQFGFYDLRLEEARLAQEELIKDMVSMLLLLHYWFNGKECFMNL